MAKFITDRILTVTKDTNASLKDAKGSEMRSLDDILAEIGKKNQVKTAATAAAKAEVKTAAKEEVKTAAPIAPIPAAKPGIPPVAPAAPAAVPATPAAAVNPTAPAAPAPTKMMSSNDLGKKAPGVEQAAAGAPVEADPLKAKIDPLKVDPLKADLLKKNIVPSIKPAVPAPLPIAAETTGKQLKVSKSIDFRDWAAEDVVKAWGQHGSIEKCASNVAKLSNDPMTYCSLLKVASAEATKVIKTAAATKAVKTAKFEKLSKLTDEKKAWLRSFWSKLYPSSYVDAMLEDY